MKATLTSKGQITIPQAIRRRLNLRPGDVLDFDETASVLVARRVIEPSRWMANLEDVRLQWDADLIVDGQSGKDLLDDLRGPVEFPRDQKEEQ